MTVSKVWVVDRVYKFKRNSVLPVACSLYAGKDEYENGEVYSYISVLVHFEFEVC